MSALNRIEDLLEISQNASIVLQQKIATVKNSQHLGILLNASKDLRAGIKDLVKIQDKLDDSASPPAQDDAAAFEASVDETIERARQYLHHAMKVSADDYTPTSSMSLSLLAAKSHPLESISPTGPSVEAPDSTPAAQNVSAANGDVDEFVDAVEEMPTPIKAQTTDVVEDQLQKFSIDVSVPPLKRSNSNFSLFSLPPNATWDNAATGEASTVDPMAKSLTIEDYFPVPTRTLSSVASTMGSASTPLPVTRNDSISLFNDDNEHTARNSDVFASDVEVSHPLRIGVGYGSYVCYSCTIYSSKGASITARKRYSDFVQLRDNLVKQYPRLKNNLPKLPPKKVVGKFTPAFIEKRRRELEYFLKYVSLHPTLGSSMEIKRWLTQ